jgi:transcription initiation factor TFIID subunit 12
MSSGAQGQPSQGQPNGGQQQPKRQIVMYKPEQMRSLPEQFTQAEKDKWEAGLRALWSSIESNGPETQQHQEAKRKLFEFSKTLTHRLQTFRAQAAQAAQQAGGVRPTSQGQPQGQGGENSGPNTTGAQQRQQPKISAKIMEHITNFPYVLPSQFAQGTPEAAKWLQEAKGRYVKGLVAMESATTRIAALESVQQKRIEEGKPFTPEEEKDFKEKKEAAQKTHNDAKNFVDNFRQQQKIAGQKANQQGNGLQQGGNGSIDGGQAAVRPQISQQPPNPALQNTQTVNAAIEAARNQQLGGGRQTMQQSGQVSQMPSTPSNPNIPQQQGGQVQNIKQEAGAPQIKTQMQGRPVQNNSPQSAVPQSAGPQSATAGPVPRALTHQAALQTAARTYSSGQTAGTPNVMGHSHTHPSAPRETQNVITNKMPIPKQLPERATAPPQPVPMPQPRPTFSGGPSNSGSGVMSQPVLQRTPGYNMEGDGDRVLSKKKLDELVRQVTGGGEGLGGGENLTPEVEEVCAQICRTCHLQTRPKNSAHIYIYIQSILTVADQFVDQVLQAACKNAKERGSKILEIRDIQLTLERGYNIRIPGYASDEIRTVRKIQPSPAWISKMSAVQASKVTGGRNID